MWGGVNALVSCVGSQLSIYIKTSASKDRWKEPWGSQGLHVKHQNVLNSGEGEYGYGGEIYFGSQLSAPLALSPPNY